MSSPSIFYSDEGKSQHILCDHDTNRMMPVQDKKSKKKAKKRLGLDTQRKQKRDRSCYIYDTNRHMTGKVRVENPMNFSQFDSYDLLLDSSSHVITGSSGTRNGLAHLQSEKVTLHSTPQNSRLDQPIFSLHKHLAGEDYAANLNDLSDVSGISCSDLSLNGVSTRVIKIGPTVSDSGQSEDELKQESSVEESFFSSRGVVYNEERRLDAMNQSENSLVNVSSVCGTTEMGKTEFYHFLSR